MAQTQLTGTVFNIQRFSIHDGPGIRTTVFLKGCPLDCRWCANPESKQSAPQLLYTQKLCVGCRSCAAACPQKALRWQDGHIVRDAALCVGCLACAAACPVHALTVEGESRTVDEVVREVMKDEPFYKKSGGGATLSGGEPLMQPAFALALLQALHERGVHTNMETSGFAAPEVFDAALRWLDLLYIDCKHPDSAVHEKMTGRPNGPILRNIAHAAAVGQPMAVRIPIIPRFNDDAATAEGFVRTLGPMGIKQVHLLPFHQMGLAKWRALGLDYLYENDVNMQKEELEPLAEVFRRAGFEVQLGG